MEVAPNPLNFQRQSDVVLNTVQSGACIIVFVLLVSAAVFCSRLHLPAILSANIHKD
jgi:hypothetical protein